MVIEVNCSYDQNSVVYNMLLYGQKSNLKSHGAVVEMQD